MQEALNSARMHVPGVHEVTSFAVGMSRLILG